MSTEAPAGGGTPGSEGGGEVTVDSLRKIQGEPDYWTNPAKQRAVADGFKKLYPAQIETAPLDRRRPDGDAAGPNAAASDGAPYAISQAIEADDGLVILPGQPGDDFEPEAGKTYFVPDPDAPLMKAAVAFAERTNMAPARFMEGVQVYARDLAAHGADVGDGPLPDRDAVWKALGPDGPQRAAALWTRLVATVGKPAALEIEETLTDHRSVVALEKLMTEFATDGGSSGGGGGKPLDEQLEELQQMQARPDYWGSPTLQRRVAEGYKRLYPGRVQTAVLDRTQTR